MRAHLMVCEGCFRVLTGPDHDLAAEIPVDRGSKRHVLELGIRQRLEWDKRSLRAYPWLAKGQDQEVN